MSPRFYFCTWLVFGAAAGVTALAGAFTMFSAVVFGFIAFGLIFTGMLCVLPSAVSHPAPPHAVEPRAAKPVTEAAAAAVPAHSYTYRSV